MWIDVNLVSKMFISQEAGQFSPSLCLFVQKKQNFPSKTTNGITPEYPTHPKILGSGLGSQLGLGLGLGLGLEIRVRD